MTNEAESAHDPLPSTTRRRFIGGGTVAAAALTLGPAVLAACGPKDSPNNDASEDSRVTVVSNVRPFGGPAVDLISVDGVFAESVPDGVSAQRIDGGGRLAVPTLIDSHIHPEKTGWGEPWQSRVPASNTAEYVAADVAFAHALKTPNSERRCG